VRSGKWLIRSVDVRAGRPRWILELPAVPSRARAIACEISALGVEVLPLGVRDEAPVEDVGDSSLQAAQCFHVGLAGCDFAPEIGAALGVVTRLDDRGDVQDLVHSPGMVGYDPTLADQRKA
jgi:hypothetical protein